MPLSCCSLFGILWLPVVAGNLEIDIKFFVYFLLITLKKRGKVNSSHSSCCFVKKAKSEMEGKSMLRKASIRLRLSIPRKKAGGYVNADLDDEASNLNSPFGKERWFDEDNNGMWLSSCCLSPPSSFQDYTLGDAYDFVLVEWLVTCLSVTQNCASWLKELNLSDGSKVQATEDALLLLDKFLMAAAPVLNRKDLINFFGDELIEPSLVCSKDTDSASCRECLSDDSNVSSPLSDSPQVWDPQKIGLWISLAPHDREQSESPEIDSLSSSVSSVVEDEQVLATENLGDLEGEPIFWPFEAKMDMGSEENWEFFLMSPRKGAPEIEIPERALSQKSVTLRLHHKKLGLQEGRKEKLHSKAGSSESMLVDRKNRTKSNRIKQNRSEHSRLKRETKKFAKTVPLEDKDYSKASKQEKVSHEKLACLQGKILEAEYPVDDERSIESLLGLEEFDGHEGVDLEFNNDSFSLDDSL